MPFRFRRSARLKSRKSIQALFAGGQSIAVYPVRAIWKPLPAEAPLPPVQVGFAVPSRRFKKAVQRNRLRRLMRESYRLRQPAFLEQLQDRNPEGHWSLMLLYTGQDADMGFETVDAAMHKLLQRLARKWPAQSPSA